jgi:hypothetical protein
MTTLEDWQRVHGSLNAAMLGAVGGGPPLRYLWIPFALVAAIAAVISLVV